MDNMQLITTFLGWCTVVNFGIYLLSVLILMGFREPVKKIHSIISAVSVDKCDDFYFNYLGFYKIAIIFLNVAPYAALKIMV
jgi:hypothetical protein